MKNVQINNLHMTSILSSGASQAISTSSCLSLFLVCDSESLSNGVVPGALVGVSATSGGVVSMVIPTLKFIFEIISVLVHTQ